MPRKHEIKSLDLCEIYHHDSRYFVDLFPVQSKGLKKSAATNTSQTAGLSYQRWNHV